MVFPIGSGGDWKGLRTGTLAGPMIPAGRDLSLALLRAKNCSVMASNCAELNLLHGRDPRSTVIRLERPEGAGASDLSP